MWPFDGLSEKSFHMLENKQPAKKTTHLGFPVRIIPIRTIRIF